ncbi:hypothetical protein [Streptomyces sp. ISL-86]|uniref:hypothetical protein n=1 Tax=Streptomyces sp. ISL-86 TaxID=2819187 RepID=UPI0035A90C9C
MLLSRRLAGRPLLRGGPDHLAHRLRRLGLTPPGATVLIGAAAFSAVAVGVLVHTGWGTRTGPLWVAGVTLAVVLGLLRVPVYGLRRPRGVHTVGRQAGVHGTGVHAPPAHRREELRGTDEAGRRRAVRTRGGEVLGPALSYPVVRCSERRTPAAHRPARRAQWAAVSAMNRALPTA